jgi:hypothetical protein
MLFYKTKKEEGLTMNEKEKMGTQKNVTPKEQKGHKNNFAQNDEKAKNAVGENDEKNTEIKELISKYVSEAVENAKAEWEKDLETRIVSEREDAARLASMTSEERAKEEMDRRQKDFETERQQYVSEKAEFEAAKELAAQNLPVTFAKLVADGDEANMKENISIFKKEYMKAIEEGLSQRLKGSLPRVSREKTHAEDPFLNGLGM